MNEEQKNALIKAYENEFDRGSEELINEIKIIKPISESEFDLLSESKTSRLNSAMQKFSSEDSKNRGMDLESYFKIVKDVHSSKFSDLNLRLAGLKVELLGD